MEYLGCPMCGSTYFYLHMNNTKYIFKLLENKNVEPVEPAKMPLLDFTLLHCGACSWQGPDTELNVSLM